MKAIIVCVEYHDYLAVSLPWNLQHFDHVLVVTTEADERTQEVVNPTERASYYPTDAFYRHGAPFNKGAAIEEAFDVVGREGWICIMDADILLPKDATFDFTPGDLHLAQRRNCPSLEEWSKLPEIRRWPFVRDAHEAAGYFQAFHADDPVLRRRPWYPTHWIHAGGCDTDFHNRWPKGRRRYVKWTVLHIGESWQNWCGRYTPYADGNLPPQAEARKQEMADRRAFRLNHGYRFDRLPVRRPKQ